MDALAHFLLHQAAHAFDLIRQESTAPDPRSGSLGSPVEMRWRIRLKGGASDLDRLRRELAAGDVVVLEDDQGTYLQATVFESLSDGDQVVPAAEALIIRLNGIFSLSGGYQAVSFWPTCSPPVSRGSQAGRSLRQA